MKQIPLKWWHLIAAALVGSGITIYVFKSWLMPAPDDSYQVKYALEQQNNIVLQKQLSEQKSISSYWQKKVSNDSAQVHASLNNLPVIKKVYVTVHDSIVHLDVDGDIKFLRSRLPRKNPY